jgi:hypothetical protein
MEKAMLRAPFFRISQYNNIPAFQYSKLPTGTQGESEVSG